MTQNSYPQVFFKMINRADRACQLAEKVLGDYNVDSSNSRITLQDAATNTYDSKVQENIDDNKEQNQNGKYDLKQKQDIMKTADVQIGSQLDINEQKEYLASVFQDSRGTIGIIQGFLIIFTFLTIKTPQPNPDPDGTVTVTINGKQYISKHNHYWSKFGRLNMIPLEKGPESQVDILNMSDIDGQNLFLFTKKEGETKVYSDIELIGFKDEKEKQAGKETKMIELNDLDSFGQISDGCPFLTIRNGRPFLCCMYDSHNNKVNQAQKFNHMILKPNLDKQKIENIAKRKIIQAEIAKLEAQKIQLNKIGAVLGIIQQEERKNPEPTSDITVIFSQNHSYQSVHNLFNQIDPISGNIEKSQSKEANLSKQQSSEHKDIGTIQKTKQSIYLNSNHVPKPQEVSQFQIEDSPSSFSKKNYVCTYGIERAASKCHFENGCSIINRNIINKIIERYYYTLMLISSWKDGHHLLVASKIQLVYKQGSPELYYETAKCQCGCSKNPLVISHNSNMYKLALSFPLKFMYAALDAIIQLLTNFIIHNDITLRNFIFYKDDFLLGDFELSCYVKDCSSIHPENLLQKNLYLLNNLLISNYQQIWKQKGQPANIKEKEQTNLFFRDVSMDQNLQNYGPSSEVYKQLLEKRLQSSWRQFKDLMFDLFKKGNCRISAQHQQHITKQFEKVEDNQITMSVLKELLIWAQTKKDIPSALENTSDILA